MSFQLGRHARLHPLRLRSSYVRRSHCSRAVLLPHFVSGLLLRSHLSKNTARRVRHAILRVKLSRIELGSQIKECYSTGCLSVKKLRVYLGAKRSLNPGDLTQLSRPNRLSEAFPSTCSIVNRRGDPLDFTGWFDMPADLRKKYVLEPKHRISLSTRSSTLSHFASSVSSGASSRESNRRQS